MTLARTRAKVEGACRLLRSGGVGALLRELGQRVATVETYLAYRVELDRPLPPLDSSPPLAVRRATEADFARFRSAPRPLSRHAEFRDQFGLDQCYLGLVDDELAHVAWIYYPHEQHLQPTRFRRLAAGEACIANCVTLPAFRGRGVYPALLQALLTRLRDEGYLRCYMYVEVENLASQRGVGKAGFRPVGRSWRVRLFYHYHRDPAAGIYVPGPDRRAHAA
jgi:RimJ/RimL family protein N-acetyltransferase